MKKDKLTFFKRQKKMLLMAALAMGSFSFSFGQTLISADFTGQTLPSGWDTISVTNDGNWAFDNPGSRSISNGAGANFDNDFAIFDSDHHCGSNEDAELVTPAFNADISGTLILSFDNSFHNFGSQEGHVEVWNGSSWTNVLTLSGTNDGYPDANHKTIDITAAAGSSTTAKVRFHWENGSCDWWWAIDNVIIENVTCFFPSNLTASNITSTGASLSWTAPSSAPANGYQYYYSTSSTAPSPATTPSGSALDTFASPSTLASNTQYYFWVRSVCSATDTSDWSASAIFTTQPAVQIPATLPYTDDFTATAGNWTILNGTETNQWYIGSAAGNPGNSLYVSDNNGTTNEYDNSSTSVVQAYRDITFPSGTNPFNLKFDWRSNGESCCDYMRVWLVPSSFVPTPGTQITASASGGLEIDDKINGSANWNTAQYIIPDSFAGTTSRLVFEWKNDGSQGPQPPAAVDNINIHEITCSTPVNATVSSITATGATLSWDSLASAPANGYQYYYSASSTAPTASTTASGAATDTFAALTSLAGNTQYYCWVRALCSATDTSDWSATPAIFTTLPAVQIPATLPYSDNFTSTGGNWTILNGTETNKWYIGSAAGNPGNSLFVSDDDGTTNEYNTNSSSVVQAYRDITFPSGGATFNLKFDWQNDGENGWDYIRVWLVPSTFMPTPGTQITASASGGIQLGGNMSGSDDWDTAQFTIPATFAGTTSRLVYEWRNDGGGGAQPPAAIDNINVTEITCSTPVNLTASSIISTGAIVSWDSLSAAPANGFQYYYNTNNTAPTASTVASGAATDTFASLSGLTSNTQYYFWVRSLCSSTDTSDWSASITFTTPCLAASIPFFEGFENGYTDANDVAGCWSQESSSETWTANGSATSHNRSPRTGSWDATLRYGFTNWLFHAVQLTANVTYKLQFYARQDGSTTSDASIEASYGTSASEAAMTNSIVANTALTNGNYQLFTGNFTPTTTGVYYIGIKGDINSNPWYITLDDISLDLAPSCIVPSGLSASNMTTSGADINWFASSSNPANGYQYYYSTSNTAPTAATTASGSAIDTFASLSGLSSNTQYYCWVRAVCSATDTSDWSATPATFTTLQIPATLPYTEDFTSTGGNWTISNGTATNQWYVGSAAGNPGNGLYISNDNGTTNAYTNSGASSIVQSYRDIALPSGSSTFNLQFDWRCVGEGPFGQWDYLRAWLVPKTYVPTPGTQISSPIGGQQFGGDYYIGGDTTWHTENFVIPTTYAGDTVRLVFEWTNDNSAGSNPPAAVDNISVIEVPPCTAPDTLTVTAVTATTADLSWNGSAADYTLEYDTAGFTLGTGNIVSVSGNTYTVPSLDPNTNYDFYVRSICTPGTDSSGYSALQTFTTACNVVTVALGNDTSFCPGATITLDAGNSGSSYLWSDNSTSQTLSVSAAGDYSVTVTNEYGCSGADTVTISANAVPVVDLGADTSICEGQTLTLDAANAGSTYLWNDASTNQTLDVSAAGDYSVAVTNTAGCTGSDTITVGVDTLPVVNLGADTAICEGQTLTLDAANAGSDYLWSDASTNQTLDVTDSGDYSVIVTNTLGCSGTDTVHVTVDPLPSASSIVVTDNGDGTYTFSAEDPSNVAGYNWDFGDGSPTSSGQLPTHTYAPGSDTFTVTLIITNECGSDTLTTTIETTGINRVNIGKNQLKLYPNPTRDVITIQNESAYKMKAVTVYNVLGQVVMQQITTDAHQYKMDVSGLTSGLYTVRIETNAGFVLRKFEVLK